MNASWQSETGHLACQWSEVGQRTMYKLRWLQEAPSLQWLFAAGSGFCQPQSIWGRLLVPTRQRNSE
jgi:hypothetical protein